MKKTGSMTVAMSLMMLVLLSLVAAGLQASKVACARTQAVNGIDTGLYSLFSEYDQELLERYHLFFLDGGYGQGTLNMGQMVNQMEYYMEPVLSSGLTKCQILGSGVDGFRIASDSSGKAVEQQMIRYMKGNLGVEGIEHIQNMLTQAADIMNEQEAIQDGGISEAIPEETEPMEGISENNNPLDIIGNIRNNGFLGMVLPVGTTVSQKETDTTTMVSKRTLQTGMGDFPQLEHDTSVLDKIWVQEYILEHMSSYTDGNSEGPLDYEVEYILGGKDSDKSNLSYVVNRLLLIREVSNIAYLYTNGQKRAELEACAAALSFLTLIPEGMTLVQAILAAEWAYVESLADVRTLLSGGKIPLIKDHASWQTQLSNLNARQTGQGTKGLTYEDYLRILFSMSSKEKAVMRSMDIIELNMRQTEGKETFAMDACVDAVSFSFLIQGPEGKQWQAERMYTYDM